MPDDFHAPEDIDLKNDPWRKASPSMLRMIAVAFDRLANAAEAGHVVEGRGGLDISIEQETNWRDINYPGGSFVSMPKHPNIRIAYACCEFRVRPGDPEC